MRKIRRIQLSNCSLQLLSPYEMNTLNGGDEHGNIYIFHCRCSLETSSDLPHAIKLEYYNIEVAKEKTKQKYCQSDIAVTCVYKGKINGTL